MTKRQKKKLRKRGGLFHYRDWKALRKFCICPTCDDVIASTWECKMNQFRMKYIKDIQKMIQKMIHCGENWGYPVQAHVDLAQNPDVTTEARIGISPKGDVKFYGFDICKT